MLGCYYYMYCYEGKLLLTPILCNDLGWTNYKKFILFFDDVDLNKFMWFCVRLIWRCCC